MTTEEAGQIILENDPWLTCPDCAGNGHTKVKNVSSADIGKSAFYTSSDAVIVVDPCRSCHSRGRLINSSYVEACTLLSVALPMDQRLGAQEQRLPLPKAIGHLVSNDDDGVRVMVTGSSVFSFNYDTQVFDD